MTLLDVGCMTNQSQVACAPQLLDHATARRRSRNGVSSFRIQHLRSTPVAPPKNESAFKLTEAARPSRQRGLIHRGAQGIQSARLDVPALGVPAAILLCVLYVSWFAESQQRRRIK